jgi:hypothetical protein
MRVLRICLACVWVLACSSSKDTAPNSTAGSGAAPSGGNVAGSRSSTASGTATGTAPGAARSADTASCPAEQPEENVTCSPVDLTCTYPSQQCTCENEGFVAVWNCRRARQVCPDALPETGSACTPGRGECMFDGSTCICSEDSSTWSCWNPADCPQAAPAEQAPCDVVGMECPYESAMEELDCECTSEGWDCGRQACPAAMPAVGEACMGGDGVCTFGAQTCDCRRRAWVCWDPSTCPATPAHDAACTVEGMLCAYSGGECECEDAAWSCDSQLRPADADIDAGM